MRRMNPLRDVEPLLARYFPSLSKGPDINHYAHMFTDDIHSGIMPIGGQTDKQKDFKVTLTGEDKECEKAKEIIGELGTYDRHDLPATLCDAVDNVTRILSWEGRAVYEIIHDNEQIYLHNFTTKNFFRLFLWCLQIIPRGDREFWKRKYTLISENKIWEISIPNKLGGASSYKKILRNLKKYDSLGPSFYRNNIENLENLKTFNHSEYSRSSQIFINKATCKWGWNRRDWSQNICTEYYTFHQMLKFNCAQAILREHIIKEINQLLDRLSIKCKIVVSGLPTSEEIHQLRVDMSKGSVSFSDVSDKVSML